MLLSSEDAMFIQEITHRVKEKPELTSAIITAITNGVTESVNRQRQKASDMEVVASMALHQRLFKGNNKFIASKIRQYHDKGQTSIDWSTTLENLER